MANIFQISQELVSIFDAIEENGGEITPELEEQLAVTQETFKDKVKSYSNAIRLILTDISAIKEEIQRLKDLQESKEKTITRLKEILTTAVETFGDTTKDGCKVVDYTTGKVSVRYNQSVLVSDDSINRFINRLVTGFKWYADNNQLEAGLVKPEGILDYINSKSPDEEADDIDIDKFNMRDIERLNASVDFDIDIKSLISTKAGIDLLRSLLEYNIFKIKCKADKKGIKDDSKGEEHYIPSYANIITNKNIIIK